MSYTTGLFSHDDCGAHVIQARHPERPERLAALLQHFRQTGLTDDLTVVQATPLVQAAWPWAHAPGYVQALQSAAPSHGLVRLDADTAMGPHSFRAALLAAGAVVQAVQQVLDGTLQRAFCAVRPPGHHAEESTAMGFCLLNNVAHGALAALQDPRVKRVAILDFDVHHGNGTVDIFKDRPEVLVCSSFQHPFYPMRHFAIRRPNIVHTPLVEGTGGSLFRSAVERDWLPALERHQPDFILVSAGFDAHAEDPLGGLELHEDDFTWVTELICSAAAQYAQGRIVSTLEGGYDLGALSRSAAAHVQALRAG